MRHFLTLKDYSKSEIEKILKCARSLKIDRFLEAGDRPLLGQTLAMIFQKPSLRTRMSFEVGMNQLGGSAINIRPEEIQMGVREPIADVAKVISRYVDVVMMRANNHQDIVEFAENSRVPVINGLCNLYHPCQAVADVLTILQRRKSLDGVRLCYIGDGNNVAHSLIEIANKLEFEIVLCCPEGYDPDVSVVGNSFELERDPEQAVAGANVVYTDVWTSMGQEEETAKRKEVFAPYRVTEELLSKAKSDVLFLHCLPAKRGEEVDEAIVESKYSAVFDQAENRLHAQKAILLFLLGKL